MIVGMLWNWQGDRNGQSNRTRKTVADIKINLKDSKQYHELVRYFYNDRISRSSQFEVPLCLELCSVFLPPKIYFDESCR